MLQTINTALTTAPLFFVRSGIAGAYHNGSQWVANQALSYPGGNAYYWSSSSNGSSAARSLAFNNTNVTPSLSNYRYVGLSLRCLYHM